ncbi:LOW QUALITY PROTEIN: RNA-binding protein 4B-like [Phyllostomus discolor]|uniref:LOW QUALITY PROTEIN: RNA-binding protein 4B-like n=1 Tax=Phyllostomus discolor TaxID=89673 RepID=A0A6J2LRZ7_9CHIR|nr:LOW QUALITY PROTEIN: RNA-binding protein 4B-like [Phyllostomus discolor]
MVKLFIGNLPREATEQEIRSLFEQYGKVLECDIIKNYGFVHIEDKTAAEDAIRNLHHYKLHGVNINVEASKNKSKASTKLHVGNISPTCTNQELRAKFEEYGPVIECDIVKDYAFVHMERAEDAVEAIRGLDNTEFQGKRMHVQLSTSRLRTAPGMGDQSGCYRCGKEGHWSKECPVDRTGRVADFTEQYNEQYGAVRTPYTVGYGESVYYNDAYGALDYYKRYRVRSYEAVAQQQQLLHTTTQSRTCPICLKSRIQLLTVTSTPPLLIPTTDTCCRTQVLWLLPPLPPIMEGTGAPFDVVHLCSPQLERATVMGQRVSSLRLQQLHEILCMTWPGMSGSSTWTERGTQPFKNWR